MRMNHIRLIRRLSRWCTHLDGRGVNLELLEDCESLFIKLAADGDVSDVGGVIVVEARDVLHHPRAVCFDGSQDQQVL